MQPPPAPPLVPPQPSFGADIAKAPKNKHGGGLTGGLQALLAKTGKFNHNGEPNPTQLVPPDSSTLAFVEPPLWCVGYGRYGRNAQGGESALSKFARAKWWTEMDLHWNDRPLLDSDQASTSSVKEEVIKDDREEEVAKLPLCRKKLRFSAVALGAAHNIAVSADGSEVFSWGKCHFGQLGHGEQDSDCFLPWKIGGLLTQAKLRVTSVACGDSFSFAITDKGRVFSWGCGFFGALGLGDERSRFSPCPVGGDLADRFVVAADGGAFHAAFLCDNGDVLCTGQNSKGQCGIDNAGRSLLTPNLVTSLCDLGPVTAVGTGCSHTAVCMADGAFLTFGENENGALGRCVDKGKTPAFLPDHVNTGALAPSELSKYGDDGVAAAVAAGSFHTVVLTKPSGRLVCFGWADSSPRAAAVFDCHGKEVVVKFTRIAAGERHYAAIDDTGCLYTAGETALGHEHSCTLALHAPDAKMGSLSAVACGSNSTIALERGE